LLTFNQEIFFGRLLLEEKTVGDGIVDSRGDALEFVFVMLPVEQLLSQAHYSIVLR
jgi:hypothetical protein